MEIWFARSWVIVSALFIAAIDCLAVWAVFTGINHWRKELRSFVRVGPKDPAPSLDTSVWISGGVVVMLNVIMLGGMDVGQFLQILLNNPEGLAWLCTAVLFPLIGGKAMTKFVSGKYGSIDYPVAPNPPAPPTNPGGGA